MNEMHSAGFGWVNDGMIVTASGATTPSERAAGIVHDPLGGGVSHNQNFGPFTEDRYIWGIQGDLYASLAVPPGVSTMDYLKDIADMGVTVTNPQTGDYLLQKGVDHYGNAPTLNDHPHFFPRPFLLAKGQNLLMTAQASDAYLRIYGGSFGFNANVIIFYTFGE